MSDAIGPGEAARRLGVSTRTVQRWLREGRLPSVKVGSRVKVDARGLTDFLPTGGAATDSPPARKIARLLVANRGELVVRIARTCRQLGIHSLALVAEDQARAWWTGTTDEIVPLRGSYLDGAAIIEAARASGADAIHPGYGFLAENAEFAAAVTKANLIWIGPPPGAMRAVGDKAAARKLAARLGVPVLTGYDGDDQSDRTLTDEAERIGLPVLVKPSAGGGGKGMHVVAELSEMAETLARARREASASFGDERLILERYLPRPRHVEVQILADGHGNAFHLGERECSLQRRHQKVIEEAPSPAVDAPLRARLGEAALALIAEAGYVGAGTVEFLLDADRSFYFLEVNARLQVEHPVTELVTGRDLVADQIAIASGEPLQVHQEDVRFDGHAIEARLYAEDPNAGFLPATGEVIGVGWPHIDGLRVDAGIGTGDVVGTKYDPLLAKLITHGSDRHESLARLETALAETSVLGVTTNRGFLRWLTARADVRAGEMYTGLIDDSWHGDESLPADAWQTSAAAVAGQATLDRGPRIGFRLNAPKRLLIEIADEERAVDLRLAEVPAKAASAGVDGSVVLDLDGRSIVARLAPAPTVESAARHAGHEGSIGESVTAPMPGTVIDVRVAEGDMVEAGQILIVLEAMKMENTIAAPAPGRVGRVLVERGQQVQRKETLMELS
jgi:acetyl-CoA/propionyl-CoA carboxylase biotin carboxyl carrier protein